MILIMIRWQHIPKIVCGLNVNLTMYSNSNLNYVLLMSNTNHCG